MRTDTGDDFELQTLDAIIEQSCGALTSGGHPPREVSGFCRLQQAPWFLVFFAHGDEILSPIIRFRNVYFSIAIAFVLIAVLMLRRTSMSTVNAIRAVSQAAEAIAKGEYGEPLKAETEDEVGELTRSFNTMVVQLKERER